MAFGVGPLGAADGVSHLDGLSAMVGVGVEDRVKREREAANYLKLSCLINGIKISARSKVETILLYLALL